jgi:uncharacterized protein (DUF2267 family)
VHLEEVRSLLRTEVTAVDHSVEKANEWLQQLASELGKPGDRRHAFRVLRAFFHTLRDRLPMETTAHLAAQLPDLLRGVYYEGWRPSRVPMTYHDNATFLDLVAADAGLAGETEAAYAVEAASRVLRRHVTAGELADVRAVLPPSIAVYLTDESERS